MASPTVNSYERAALMDTDPSRPHSETPYASSDLSPTSNVSTSQRDWPSIPRNNHQSLDYSTRARGLSTASTSSFVKRKPLPTSASPLATRFSSGEHLPPALLPPVDLQFTRSFAEDSPTLHENPLALFQLSPEPRPSEDEHSEEKQIFSNPNEPVSAQTSPSTVRPHLQSEELKSPRLTVPKTFPHNTGTSSEHARLTSELGQTTASESSGYWYDDYTSSIGNARSDTMSIFSNKPLPPHKLTLPVNVPARTEETTPTTTPTSPLNINKSLPKSPGASKLGSFFGWGGSTSPASSTTTFSEDNKEFSPLPSPPSPQSSIPKESTGTSRAVPASIDIPRANANDGDYFSDAYLQIPQATPGSTIQVDDMEDELKLISAELATSIRREMELEDLVDRLQSEAANPSGAGKRTSDYFSDSGTSSVKYGGELDARSEELERMQRRTEREKAQIRVELTDKVQDERTKRKALESQIRSLEERASQADLYSMNSLDASGRLKELENTCEDLRRRLNEERQVKDNFEDLLGALKSELQNSHNERDNLRDEVVPQLRARVEGLEAQAAEHEKRTYENTKMQQEMQTLKNENTTLINARKLQLDMQQQMNKFNTITEETPPTPAASIGLSRSNTVSNMSSSRGAARPASLSRSNSVKAGESREVLADRVKDIEAQRDALHRALKNLLERQELQNRENQKRIRQLEMERDRALTSSPGRLGYDKEVANLREEINTLRRRADEAIEQKWQCEKGLSGLKMDLERAEQEISSLRGMLRDTDASVQNGRGNRNSITSDSLARSYKDLQTAYSTSLERVKELEKVNPQDANTESALRALETSLSAAINERDFALSDAERLRSSISSLQESVKDHISGEVALADDLRASAKRVEELATQVRQQLSTNATLRQRLAETIDRGEKEQKSNAARIVFMQGKLRSLEEELVGAQQISEDRIAKHEEEIRNLTVNQHSQLKRVRDSMKSPRQFGPKSPLSPLFSATRSPRISRTSTGPGISVSQESQISLLRGRVMELEKALEEADKEMEEVVGRMNTAQIEVMELWNEREEAVRVTKRLEREIEQERKKGFESRFKTLAS